MAELAWILDDGREQSLRFDAVTRESHEAVATVTEHPVEDGANISDHVRKGLDRVSMEVVVSNTPTAAPSDHADGVTGRHGSVSLTGADGQELARANVLVFDGPVVRVRSVYEELLALMAAGARVRVLTSLREYDGMVIKRVSPIREARTGSALVATVEAQELITVSSEIVDAPEPREPRGRRSAEVGRENTDEADPPETGRSLLASAADGLASFFGGG